MNAPVENAQHAWDLEELGVHTADVALARSCFDAAVRILERLFGKDHSFPASSRRKAAARLGETRKRTGATFLKRKARRKDEAQMETESEP